MDRRLLSEQTQTIMAHETFQWLMKNPEEFTDYVNKWKRGDVDFVEKYKDVVEKEAKPEKESELGNQGGPTIG